MWHPTYQPVRQDSPHDHCTPWGRCPVHSRLLSVPLSCMFEANLVPFTLTPTALVHISKGYEFSILCTSGSMLLCLHPRSHT